jgi:hypothetical protein
LAATVGVGVWALTTGASYQLVSHFAHIRPVTAVNTSRREVGVLVDAPGSQVAALARLLSERGLHVSFGLEHAPTGGQLVFLRFGDQAVPRLRGGGLVRWLETGDQLKRVAQPMGVGRHFLYASSGPSIGQWWLAHRDGGRLVAGAVRLGDVDDSIGALRPGEVVELVTPRLGACAALAAKLERALRAEHLQAVPVARLIRDAGARV